MNDKLREILTEYNNTLIGRCPVCLENFCESEEELASQKFADRPDLIRID
jgi:hypothetical protein